jgi:polar amino acid transport system ATP-binding protein
MTMAIVTHEMDFARDVSSRVFYMDEGTIYEEGTPQQVFEHPRREKTRSFIHRIRSLNHRITSVDFDLYALNAEIEQFCEKHLLSRAATHDLQLLVEELLYLHKPILQPFVVDLSVAYSEKNGRLSLVVETADTGIDPLEVRGEDDGLSIAIVRGTAEAIDHRQADGRSRLELALKTR